MLATLAARAEAASGEESAYRRESARRIETLERARAFAYRRLNLLKKVAETATDEADTKKAADARIAAAFVEIGWIGANLAELDEKGREAEAKFRPVAEAIGASDEPGLCRRLPTSRPGSCSASAAISARSSIATRRTRPRSISDGRGPERPRAGRRRSRASMSEALLAKASLAAPRCVGEAAAVVGTATADPVRPLNLAPRSSHS